MKYQFMKKLLSGFIVSLVLVAFNGISYAKNFDDSVSHGNEYPGWFKNNPFNDLEQVNAEAAEKGKQGLMLVYGTKGCSYCEQFVKNSLSDPKLADMVKASFESVGMEIFDDTEMVSPSGEHLSIKQFASKEDVQFSPTLLFYDTDGSRLLRVTGYQSPERFKHILSYVTGKHYRTGSLRDYFKKIELSKENQKKKYTLKPDYLFSQIPYMFQKASLSRGQPIVVLFEKNGCDECNDFHESVLSKQDVRKMLKKFSVVRLDSKDSRTVVREPSGRLTTPAAWFARLGFSRQPALLFYNEKGEKVLETDALVKQQRMMNAMNFVLEHAYKKNWSYQRFARKKAIERSIKKTASRN